jgi:hypothetical protein
MSEYQYYEFRAIDRPLTDDQMAKLRAISSRAEITATSLVNVYHYGDFRGNPQTLMAKYFDAFLYVANWGTHTFMLRLPERALGRRECAPFIAGESLSARYGEEYTVLCFSADELETDWEEGDGLIDSLLPIRADLLRGDYRALYLGWLFAVWRESVDAGQLEPPVPAGLRDLSPALTSLAEFLDIDSDLLEVAAELSADRELSAPSSEMLAAWIAGLPEREKNSLLFQVASGEDPHVGANLMRRFERECQKTAEAASPASRTAGELYAAAELRRSENARRAEERKRLEQEREAQRRAAEREKFLDSLEGREAETWDELDPLIANKRQSDYGRAVTAQADLRDLANRKNGAAEFQERLGNLCARHATKSSFLRKLKDSRLPSSR